MKIRDMDWCQLEAYCITLLRKTLQEDIWHIQYQDDRHERDGMNQRMDFYIAEHRPGGGSYVIACKHYQEKVLSQEDIEQVLDETRRGNYTRLPFVLIRRHALLLSSVQIPAYSQERYVSDWNSARIS
jgi:hypothetical protein